MRKKPFILFILYCFFLLSGRVYGIGERIITLGSTSSWNFIEKRQGVIEAPRIRPEPVLVLAEGQDVFRGYFPGRESAANGSLLDLYLSFDQIRAGSFSEPPGHYTVSISPEPLIVSAPLSRAGSGAALFNGGEAFGQQNRFDGTQSTSAPIVLKPAKSALFAPGSRIRDFSIEFWLYPMNVENGEQILSWLSTKPGSRGSQDYQRIQCIIQRSRMHWTFTDFFFSPDNGSCKTLSFSGPPILPRNWSHHLIRFDADLGLLEYLVNGRVEALDYVTTSGREGGEVYTPLIGEDCRFLLGSRFSGIMDEFRIYRSYLENATLARYPAEGGRVESRTMDLGHTDSRVLRIEAFGGRTGGMDISGSTASRTQNVYAGNGPLRFSDHAELRFFIRTSNSPYRWNDIPWVPVNPGTDLSNSFFGRYVQIGVSFYPGEYGETSPYLSELRIIYSAAEPPSPPTQVIVVADNGAVDLSWKASPSKNVGGYYVYYGTARGEYFGNDMPGGSARASPIDAGNRTSIRIEGLNNGTLYYFAVAAYNRPESSNAGERMPEMGRIEPGHMVLEPGEFSREVAARPLPAVLNLRPTGDG